MKTPVNELDAHIQAHADYIQDKGIGAHPLTTRYIEAVRNVLNSAREYQNIKDLINLYVTEPDPTERAAIFKDLFDQLADGA